MFQRVREGSYHNQFFFNSMLMELFGGDEDEDDGFLPGGLDAAREHALTTGNLVAPQDIVKARWAKQEMGGSPGAVLAGGSVLERRS